MEQTPAWTDNVLQGLTYWVGYKKQYYRFYPLSEGALVAELLSLLSANTDSSSIIIPEVMYKKICSEWKKKDGTRVDISIAFKKKENFSHAKHTHTVIEVKRDMKGNKNKITNDIERLAKCLSKSNISGLRGFLILVSQDHRPEKFVSSKGNARHKEFKIEKYPNYIAKVRRVCKSTSSFKGEGSVATEHAHYACLIEVCIV